MTTAAAVFVVCAAACVVAHVGILRSVVRRDDAVSPDVPRPRMVVEIVWAAVPLVALAIVLLATYTRVRREPMPTMHHMPAGTT